MKEPKSQYGKSDHENTISQQLNTKACRERQKAQRKLFGKPIIQNPLLSPNPNSLMDPCPRLGDDTPNPNQNFTPFTQKLHDREEQSQNLSRDRKWKRRAREVKGVLKLNLTGGDGRKRREPSSSGGDDETKEGNGGEKRQRLEEGQPVYTWSNHRKGRNGVWEKTDRAMANKEWLNLFPSVGVKVSIKLPSDHLPLIVSENGLNNSRKKRNMKRIYRF
ncbi:hypothetical protein U1Q18_022625 [Sarracenia purpurea var. burkii]